MISMEKLGGRLKYGYIDCNYVNLDKCIPVYVKPLNKYLRKESRHEMSCTYGRAQTRRTKFVATEFIN